MNIFAIVLLLLVGVVFVSAPAGMITNLVNDQTDFAMSATTMVVIIFAYYIIATIVPVDKIIGRFYPLFGALLIFMSAFQACIQKQCDIGYTRLLRQSSVLRYGDRDS